MTDGLFHCEDCDAILEENDNAENVKYSQEVLARYTTIFFFFVSIRSEGHEYLKPLCKTTRTVLANHFATQANGFFGYTSQVGILISFLASILIIDENMQLCYKNFSRHRWKWKQ